MKKLLLILLMLTSAAALTAQNIKRVEVSGRIIVVNTEDVEGVTVYNTSTNVGTVTDSKGEFKIEAGILDEIEISALQFDPIKVKIDLEVIETKQLTVFLVEHINRLNEVVIFPYGLTGVLYKDLDKIQTFSPDVESINMAFGDITAYEFSDDYHSKVDNKIMRQGEFYNGVNLVTIANTFLKPLFKKKESKTSQIIDETEAGLGIRGIYSHSFITENFGIPGPRVDEFISHVDENIDPKLLEPGQEMQLIEYLSKESKVFLNQ
ncbi:carboxypeptidase-like regulatory domain-containing protein [Formosa haliotis]|uniref:carboxypeptidase-like regulatory domain-containing protein n=1 Tax=Formosa haliotis TaxID=1555194 RepID=UPI000824DB16|nr:carboxypeptidase-like regulatory domain-containing protein [Formosa haliotis]